ncbi:MULTISPECIES: L-serine ammonia-lyase [Pseudovibrio]|uniref:L-serine dehydratase n=1 Tax=Pseudovibrio ascidiaceicola TaxID=285279 RepID=A0A1I3V158_9HYPH|nr:MULTISPECIES: L-serine ammonia-lyase [Pseudovibrio]KZL16932.1 L-serine dehydratase TdcG [Pseudovibrio sp. Ad26]SFJ87891.1 L-serine ammonia-lyase [Pseudovibrio ascidiaceicola]
MFLSVFEIFKIGIGPSSSHTMGPMTAAARFLDELRDGRRIWPGAGAPKRLRCTLHGSLAWTGKGHATDRAVILGLAGCTPETLDPDEAEALEKQIATEKKLHLPDLPELDFDPDKDVIFDFEKNLPGHANGMVIEAYDAQDRLHLQETFYSIGGGFVLTEEELDRLKAAEASGDQAPDEIKGMPYPFATAQEMLEMGQKSGKTIAEMKRANEITSLDPQELDTKLWKIWDVMNACMERGLNTEGELPGGLTVKRRAAAIKQQLEDERGNNMSMPHVANDWLSVYAMAVNEENAAGGKVVTAPTNGAAGVIPATVKYYREHCPGSNDEGIKTFLLTSAAVGGIIKHNASISGAEVGCQGEVGSAAAMAAAGLCAALGGTNEQIENAAEIALEHHLGMTCDPVGGLVQVPCIERNGLGAIKAVSAASLALRGDGSHYMPLDNCVEAMRQTGVEMNDKYKETSKGGLAVNLPEC